jgi:hypothetical protein
LNEYGKAHENCTSITSAQNGKSALLLSLEKGFTDLALVLVQHGADVNIVDKVNRIRNTSLP